MHTHIIIHVIFTTTVCWDETLRNTWRNSAAADTVLNLLHWEREREREREREILMSKRWSKESQIIYSILFVYYTLKQIQASYSHNLRQTNIFLL